MNIRRFIPRRRRPKSDRGAPLIETAAALVFVSVLIGTIAALQPGNVLHDGVRKAICIVEGPECNSKSWVEVEDTDPPQRRPVTFGDVPEGSVKNEENRQLGKEMAAERGWEGEQWKCLDNLWQRESGWDHTAINPSSDAAGIPQLLPMEDRKIPQGFYEDPAVQIEWGLDYIATNGNFSDPCGAWEFWQNPSGGPDNASTHWY